MSQKILIVGSDTKWEELELTKAAPGSQIIEAQELEIRLTNESAKIFYQNVDFTDQFKNSRIIFRRTRGNREKMSSLASIADHWQVPHTDSVTSIITNLDKILFMPGITCQHIQHIPTTFLSCGEKYQGDLTGRILTKPSSGRHGEGIEIFDQASDIPIYEDTTMVQPFLNIAEEYRIFVIGSETLGAVKKIPAEGTSIANYAAGAQFLPTELPQKLLDESIDIAKQLSIDIAGIDIAKVADEYYLLEVNRCPEFRAFSKAHEINVAEKIIKFLQQK